MIKKILVFVFVVPSIFFMAYLVLPSPHFPNPPSGSFRSPEPGDNETPLRQAYYTNATREEVIQNYKVQFERSTFLSVPFFVERHNFPPENAQTIIRDQTKSTFLEELIHPFRESIYINGYEPTNGRVKIIANGVVWRQKITVKYVPSSLFVRIFFGILTILIVWVLFKEYKKI